MQEKRRLSDIPNRVYLIGLLIVLLLLLLWLILGPGTGFKPTAISPICNQEGEPQNDQASNGFFIDRQVIVTGPKEAIDGAELQDELQDGVLIVDCNLSFLSERSFDPTIAAPRLDGKEERTDWYFDDPQLSDEEERAQLVMRLYEFGGDEPIEDIIAEINKPENANLRVYAEPNYLTSAAADPEPCGLPYAGGSGGGGTPYGGMAPLAGHTGVTVDDQFRQQWALGQQGISSPVFSEAENGTQWSANGVRVGVFDTAPAALLSSPTSRSTAAPTPFPAQPIAMNLKVTNAIAVPVRRDPSTLDVSDHGLFVAGLINAVAPGSDIRLVRVLNDQGCGTLFDIAKAIHDFGFEMSVEKVEGKRVLNKVVINLSLGIHKPDEQSKDAAPGVRWDSLPGNLVSFETVIGEVHDMGAIVVAASGNDSSPGNVLGMVYPAAYDTAIGVAATNMQPDRSCYSNRGDVAAPGGDGGQDLTPAASSDPSATPNPCVPRAESWSRTPLPPQCSDMENCRYGLISLALNNSGNAEYVYWSGTSFATPLVSGLAARIFGSQTGPSGSAALVQCQILEGAQQHQTSAATWGMIDANYSLNSTSCGLQ